MLHTAACQAKDFAPASVAMTHWVMLVMMLLITRFLQVDTRHQCMQHISKMQPASWEAGGKVTEGMSTFFAIARGFPLSKLSSAANSSIFSCRCDSWTSTRQMRMSFGAQHPCEQRHSLSLLNFNCFSFAQLCHHISICTTWLVKFAMLPMYQDLNASNSLFKIHIGDMLAYLQQICVFIQDIATLSA